MLPKFIYESLPYVNLTIGVSIICCYQSVFTAFSGLLFFAVGAVMWMLRSDHRRKDQHCRQINHLKLRRELYEVKPFFYIVFGLLATNWIDVVLVDLAGASVALFGLFVVIKRSIHRYYATPK
jgi:hypothetical protein